MLTEVTELDMPDLRGEDGSSSAASCLLAVCHYFGCQPHGGGDFERLLERTDQGETSPDDIVRAAQDLGLEAGANPMSADALVTAIEDGHPVIADLGGRYAVVFGVTTAGLLVMDPTRGHDVLPMEQWPGQGIILDMPGAERHTEDIERQLHPHEAIAHHYSNVWNVLHEQGEQVPHWEMAGAHENLSGTDWHVDLGHDGVWRPLHVEDMQRVYLWPKVEKHRSFPCRHKGHFAAVVRKSWEESKHPRGNPENAGEFAPKGGGGQGGAVGNPVAQKPQRTIADTKGGRAILDQFKDYADILPDGIPHEQALMGIKDSTGTTDQGAQAVLDRMVQNGYLKEVDEVDEDGNPGYQLDTRGWAAAYAKEGAKALSDALQEYGPLRIVEAEEFLKDAGMQDKYAPLEFLAQSEANGHIETFEDEYGHERIRLSSGKAKSYGPLIEKAGRRRKPDPQQGLFGQWTEGDKPTPRKTPQSSEAFEGMHPRRGQGAGGGRFSRINTGKAPGQQELFGSSGYEGRAEQELAPAAEATLEGTHHAPKGGVTLAGTFFAGGRFIPNEAKEEATPAEKQELIDKEHEQLQQAEQQLGEPEYHKAAAQAQETRQQKLKEYSDQDKSVREQARVFNEVIDKPEAASTRDLTIARGFADLLAYQSKRRFDRGEINQEQLDAAYQSFQIEADHIDRILRDRINGRSSGPEDQSRAEKIAEKAVQENRSALSVAKNMGLTLDEYRDLRPEVDQYIEEFRKLDKGETSEARRRAQERARQVQAEDAGFTGIDANGHEWVNGEQVTRGAEESAQPEPPVPESPAPEPTVADVPTMTHPPLQPHGVLLSFQADDKRPSREQREETAQQLIAMGNQAQDRLKELHYYRATQAADDAVRLASQAGRAQDTPTRQHLHSLVADLQQDLAGRVAKAEAARAAIAEDKPTSVAEPSAEEPPPVDVPTPTEDNTPEPSTQTEEPHVEQPIAREPGPEPAAPAESQPGPGGVSESERGGDAGGSASGNAGGERPRSAGPRIITARSEHTQTADPGLVPQSVRGHLNEAQQQGTALAIDAMTKHGGFLLADGTGLGKTRQQLAVAQHFLDQGRKVVIVSPAEVIKPDWKKGSMSGSFANDSSVMGVPVKLTKGDGKIEPGSAHITTYNELGKLKGQIDKNTVVIFDESHFMKNRDSARFKHGAEIFDKAAAVMYATATPGDKPLHIAHLVRAGVFGSIGKTETYQKLGMRLVDQRVYGGGTVKVWQIDPKVGYKEVARRLSGLFDQMTKDGLMVKRELAMDTVNFRADRVSLSDEEHAAVRQAYDQKLKETRSAAFPNGNKAVALMTARMRQEPFKIPATVGMVQEELAAGRSPIVFLGRVNDITDEEEGKGEGESETSFGTAGLLKDALLAAGIPAEQIGELHGAATKTPDAKKKAMNNFQEGKTRVMIATVQSGGTGINLDDTTGERPRTVIMMTPPFTANDMAQAIGRVHRLNTKSESKVRGVLVDTHIDDWNAGILENKFRTLGAVVSGESTRGQAAYTPPEGLEEEESKEPYVWGESLHPQPKFHANTPYVHNEVIGQFGGKRVNQGGEWTTQFPSREHYERYRQHVAPKPAPAPQPARPETVTPAASPLPSVVPLEQPAVTPMSAARKEAIHQALRQLHAANQDRASQRNGEGFNRMDSDFGGQLAEQSSLTDRQAAAAARMLAKYRRQLGDELHGQITKPDKAEVASPSATTTSPEPAQGAIGESPRAAVDLGEIPTKRVKTSRGDRTVYSFRPTDSFWQARKEGKIPSNVTVRKDPRSGLWEVSIWGDSDKDIHNTVADLLRKKVQMHGFTPPGD